MSLGKFVIDPVIPLGLIFLLLFLGLAAAIIQYGFLRRKLSNTRALILSLLRFLAFATLISFGLNPFLLERKENELTQTLNILIDTSPSMGLSGPGGKGSRLDEAKAWLLDGAHPLFKSLSEKFDVRLYGLGDSLRALKEGDLSSLNAGSQRAELNEAMEKLGHRNSLAILLSDGNLKWDQRPSTGPPLLTVPLGDPKTHKDILIKTVKAPAIAFRGREVVIDITVKAYGYAGRMFPMVLRDGGKLVAARDIPIQKSREEITLSLSFVPEKVGQHHLHLSIPSQAGENLISNNEVNLSLKVIRDKIRILMISGSPSLNYRFMRMALKNDPFIDLLSFVILRTPSDILNVPIQEQSLIPFPVETLFTKELNHFDLLLFDNLTYHLYISPNYYERVRDFVKEGGGFAMIGGPQFLDEGRYTGTPISEILPVKLSGREGYRRDSRSGVRLSQSGKTHPITQLSSREGENVNLWKEMPALDGINLLEPKSFKTVLLESDDGASRPILTVGNYGKGRVLILATDYSWKWYMGMVAKGKGHWAYLRFMEKMVRWLTQDPSLDPIQILLPEGQARVGQETEFRIKVRDEGGHSTLRDTVSLSVFNSDGIKIKSQARTAGQPGEHLGSFLPDKRGIYKVNVKTSAGNVEELLVIHGAPEDQDVSPDPEMLRIASASTGGKLLAKGDDLLKELESYGGKTQSSFIEEKRIPFWGMLCGLLLVLGLLGTEWYLRRRWGLI